MSSCEVLWRVERRCSGSSRSLRLGRVRRTWGGSRQHAPTRSNQSNGHSHLSDTFETFKAATPVHSRLSDRVYASVLSQVFDGTLKAGQRITEGRIAGELGVSMVSVREAMAKLAQDGWVGRFPNRGSYISDFQGPDTYRRLCRLRATVEIGAFYYLAENADSAQLARLREILESIKEARRQGTPHLYHQGDIEFHQIAIHFTAGERLSNLFRPVLLQCFAFSPVRPEMPNFLDDVVDVKHPEFSHVALLQTLTLRQSAKAARLIQQHVMLNSDDARPNPDCPPDFIGSCTSYP